MSRAHSPTFSYVTAHYPTLPLFYLRHSSFSNLSVALPTSQLIIQPFRASPTSQFILQPSFRFSYVTSSSLISPGEPPMIYLSQIGQKLCQYGQCPSWPTPGQGPGSTTKDVPLILACFKVLSFFIYYLGFTTKMPVDQMPVGGF